MAISTSLFTSSRFTRKSILKQHSYAAFRAKVPQPYAFKPLCSLTPDSESDSGRPPPKSLMSLLRAIPDWADGVKERRVKQKRSLYTHEKWVQHRSSLRHVRHVISSASSRVILSLVPPVIFFTCVAIVIASYNSAVEMEWLPGFFPVFRASSLPYQLTAPALALLLVFRTEASYSRFQEGRKAWAKVIAGTNDLARHVLSLVKVSNGEMIIKNALLRYIMAFPFALKCHLTHGSDVRGDLQNLLESDDLDLILESKYRPHCIIDFISHSLQLLNLDESKSNMLEMKISCLHEGIEICEQLLGIPIPLSYTRLTSRFLVLWHLTLPIILWDDCHWIVVPATFISAASLFCIEEVGVLIEEPFPMLALDEMCSLLRSNVQESINSERVIRDRLVAKAEKRIINQSPNGWPKS